MRLRGNQTPCLVQTFKNDPNTDFLPPHNSLGLTLTGADTVLFVEHDWRSMKDVQATDRAHRLGRTKVVNVYHLITKGTLEEKIMGFVISTSEGYFSDFFFKVCIVSSSITRIRLTVTQQVGSTPIDYASWANVTGWEVKYD
jgi:hypothetical protein